MKSSHEEYRSAKERYGLASACLRELYEHSIHDLHEFATWIHQEKISLEGRFPDLASEFGNL